MLRASFADHCCLVQVSADVDGSAGGAVVFLGHCCFACVARIWSHKLQRTALPAEHLLLQGIPLLQDNSAWKNFVFDKAADPFYDQMFLSLSGNAMHRAVVGTWAAYIVGSLSPCARLSALRFRSTSQLTLTTESGADDDER